MLPFESAVNETARYDPGKWDVWETDGVSAECKLQVQAGRGPNTIPVPVALVKFTSDLSVGDHPSGWEDETARANASILADGPRLLRCLARLVDCVYAQAANLHGNAELLSSALHHARELLAAHTDNAHAVEWWHHVAESLPADRAQLVEQFVNREGT